VNNIFFYINTYFFGERKNGKKGYRKFVSVHVSPYLELTLSRLYTLIHETYKLWDSGGRGREKVEKKKAKKKRFQLVPSSFTSFTIKNILDFLRKTGKTTLIISLRGWGRNGRYFSWEKEIKILFLSLFSDFHFKRGDEMCGKS
jgi:hypothetical protein